MIKEVLFLSNGHGEDRIACTLIEYWKRYKPEDNIRALAMVGEGRFYRQNDIPLIVEPAVMPSAGFSYLNLMRLGQDVKAGLVSHLMSQIRELKRMKGCLDLVVSVGDIVPVIGASLLSCPVAFIGCALSDHYLQNGKNTYDPIQKYLLKKRQALVFPRDHLTFFNLSKLGLNVRDCGNPMIDCIEYSQDIQLEHPYPNVLLLPGSHHDSIENFKQLIFYLKSWKEQFNFLVILSQDSFKTIFSRILLQNGWHKKGEGFSNHYSYLKLIPSRQFGDAINIADAAIGTSGTANEQCVSHAIPVLSFKTKGKQYTHSFADAQQRLLGDALSYIKDCCGDKLLFRLRFVLTNKSYRHRVKQIATERFGAKGSAGRIVQEIHSHFFPGS